MTSRYRTLLEILGLNSIATSLDAELRVFAAALRWHRHHHGRTSASDRAENNRFQQIDMQRLRDVQELRSEFEGIGIQLLDVFTKTYESKMTSTS